MTLALLVIFVMSLTSITILTIVDARRQRATPGTRKQGSQSEWTEVARALELELSPWTTPEDASMRGTIDDHWISIEQHADGLEVVVNYQSGLDSMSASTVTMATRSAPDRMLTGDQVFDSEIAVFTRAPEQLDEYLTPARRNALLWLHSSFALGDIDNEMLDVCFNETDWNTSQLISAVKLVVDVASIMEQGEKVFMAPPLATVGAEAPSEPTWGPRLVVDEDDS